MTFLHRLRQILMVGGVETFGVVMAGVAGLVIVNLLPKEQYAAYTFLMACMTLMLGITDTGIAHCCLPLVGQRTKEIPWVVGVCRQVFRKRWWLLLGAYVFVVPYWAYTTSLHGWWGAGYWIASALVAVALLFNLREHYANEVLTILAHVSTLNRIAFLSHGLRLALVIAVLLALPLSQYSLAGVVAAYAVASLAGVLLLRQAFRAHEVIERVLDPADARQVDKRMYRIAKPLVLPAVFYQLQGVITIFIVSLFGTADMLAEVGAFGRLAMILVVVDRVAAVLLFPAIARTPEGERLAGMVVKAHLAYIGMMALMLLSALVLPQYWMLLLGSQYKDRESLVWMVFLSSLLMASAGFAFRTVAARGHTLHQSYVIPFVLALQLGYLALFGVQDLPAVLGFNIATSLANFLYQYAMLAVWFAELRRRRP